MTQQVAARRSAAARETRAPRAYSNPYLAGVGIGLVMLAAFVLVGRGLGASGALSVAVATGVRAVAPEHGAGNAFYDTYAQPLLQDWLVLEVIGIALGGLVSALLAGRFQPGIERGAAITPPTRLVLAFGGGCIMGIGAKLARGCTSGLGLTGGALLSVGSWLFLLAAFVAAYATAPLVRRAWR
jgi:uncharacterized membrane protein YedE/YeeE